MYGMAISSEDKKKSPAIATTKRLLLDLCLKEILGKKMQEFPADDYVLIILAKELEDR